MTIEKKITKLSGAHSFVKSLLICRVNTIFGYPGGAIMPIYDALFDYSDKIHHVLVRHEQGGILAAIGYARATGKVGVCMATSGPGATNLVTGLADAMLDSVPLVCITAQVNSSLLGTDAFQEADIIGISVPVTKWNKLISKADDIFPNIIKAMEIAQSGKPGPVLLDITKDAQVEFLSQIATDTFNTQFSLLINDPVSQTPFITKYKNELNKTNLFQEGDLEVAAKLINNADKPYMFVGNGVNIANAQAQVLELAEKADIPVAETLHGLSCFPQEHTLYKGMLGMHGNYATNLLTEETDLVIAVGMRFDDRVTGNLNGYLPNAKVIHVEIEPAEINKNVLVDVSLQGDAKGVLQQLIPLVKNNKHDAWNNRFSQLTEKEYNEVTKQQLFPSNDELSMAEVIALLSEQTKGDAIIVSDVGQNQMMAAKYYKFGQAKSHITSGGLGTMGYALPAAIGAQLGCMDRLVIAVCGDGGIQMNIQELAVVTQENLPLKILLLNNSYLGMVRQWQEFFFDKRYSFTELHSPDFVTVAKGYGIEGEKVDKREQLDSAINRFISTKGSYLLEVTVAKEDNVFPMVPSGEPVGQVKLTQQDVLEMRSTPATHCELKAIKSIYKFSLRVNNTVRVLQRISTVISRNNFNIHRLDTYETADENISILNLILSILPNEADKLTKNLTRIIEVLDVNVKKLKNKPKPGGN